MSASAQKYKVGYKRPPKQSQFKKGQSGNPGGRRRMKAGTLRDALEVILGLPYRDGEMLFREKIASNLVLQAASGDHRSVRILLREFE